MNQLINPTMPEINRKAQYYKPSLCIIMPFEPKMVSKKMLSSSLMHTYDKVKHELMEIDPDEMGMLVLHKLQNIISNLDYTGFKKSIAIYVSPVFEKILYLDIPVEEKLFINESFEIRDLIFSKAQIHKYLVLVLDRDESRIFLGNTDTFVMIVTDKCKPAKELPELNNTVIPEGCETQMGNFFHNIDNTLKIILNCYHLPLFVSGTENMVAHFKKHSKHNAAVIDYVSSNEEKASIEHLKELIQPYVANWKKVIQKDLLNKIKEADAEKKLAVGIRDVWKEAMRHNGHLLIVEKSYMHSEEPASIDEVICRAIEPYPSFSYIKDEVDDIIEKVLESGGDVEFVDKEIMTNYNHIAMVQYY